MTHTYKSFVDALQVTLVYSTQYDFFDEPWNLTPRYLPYSVLWYIIDGNIAFTIDGQPYTGSKGDIIHLPYASTVSGKTKPPFFSVITVRFDARIPLFANRIWSEVLAFPTVYPHDRKPLVDSFYQIKQLYKQSPAGRNLMLQGTFQLLLGKMLSSLYEEGERRQSLPPYKTDTRVQAVLNHIHGHSDRLPDMADLCKMVRLSPSHLRAIFHQHTGSTIIEYVHKIKIDLAKQKLLQTDDRVSEIAWKLGFENSNYFSRLFKKITGQAPNDFRRGNQLL